MEGVRIFFLRLGLGIIVLGFVWIIFQLFETKFVTAMYEGRLFGFLNRVIEGQSERSLDYYLVKAHALFHGILLWSAVTWFLLVALLQFVHLLRNRMSKVLVNLFIVGLAATLSFLFGEFMVRAAGFEAWPPIKEVRIEPGGEWAIPNSTLGYALKPGTFKAIFPTGYACTMSHSNDLHRLTHPVQAYGEKKAKPQIWIFGCSFSYGFSLNDDETYAWQLQSKLPDYEVVNFSVSGYGTLQSFLAFQEALKKGQQPVAVVYAYGSFHDQRNTVLEKWRLAVARYQNKTDFSGASFFFPKVRFGKDGQLVYSMADMRPKGLPFVSYSALLCLLERTVLGMEDDFVRSQEVTKVLIADFNRLSTDNGIQFVVAGIDTDSKKMLAKLRQEGIKTVDISVDLSGSENRNMPHDSHPNSKANQAYAEKLYSFLKSDVLQKSE